MKSSLLQIRLLSIFIAAAFIVVPQANAAIFGMDNRINVTQGSPYASIAKSTAIAVLSSNTSINAAGRIDLSVDAQDSLCKDERFAQQPSLSNACTGFLVAPDLLATAGHCVYAVNSPSHDQQLRHETQLACKEFTWLFDFIPNAGDKTQTMNIDPARMFRCKEIIYAVHKESQDPWTDYALIRLDRPATGRTPYKINTGSLTASMSLAALGYPYGTPAKYSNAAHITINNPARSSFVTTLDVMDGFSGGPVLNTANEVVGILIGGTPMFDRYNDTVNKCDRVNKCTENGASCKLNDTPETTKVLRDNQGIQGTGSVVQRIEPILDLMKSIGAAR